VRLRRDYPKAAAHVDATPLAKRDTNWRRATSVDGSLTPDEREVALALDEHESALSQRGTKRTAPTLQEQSALWHAPLFVEIHGEQFKCRDAMYGLARGRTRRLWQSFRLRVARRRWLMAHLAPRHACNRRPRARSRRHTHSPRRTRAPGDADDGDPEPTARRLGCVGGRSPRAA
jgi:hypothetical protein